VHLFDSEKYPNFKKNNLTTEFVEKDNLSRTSVKKKNLLRSATFL